VDATDDQHLTEPAIKVRRNCPDPGARLTVTLTPEQVTALYWFLEAAAFIRYASVGKAMRAKILDDLTAKAEKEVLGRRWPEDEHR